MARFPDRYRMLSNAGVGGDVIGGKGTLTASMAAGATTATFKVDSGNAPYGSQIVWLGGFTGGNPDGKTLSSIVANADGTYTATMTSGSTNTHQATDEVAWGMIGRLSANVWSYSPDVCICMAGTNDSGGTLSALQVANGLRDIATLNRQNGIETVFIELLPRSTNKDAIVNINAQLRYMCQSNGLHLIPAYSTFAKQDGAFAVPANTVDGLHLSAAGLTILEDVIDAYISAYPDVRPNPPRPAQKAFDPTSVLSSPQVRIDATGGTFTLTVDGQTTAANAFNISASDLQNSIQALTSVGVNNCFVSGGPGSAGAGTPYILRFVGTLVGATPTITANGALLTGGASAATVIQADQFFASGSDSAGGLGVIPKNWKNAQFFGAGMTGSLEAPSPADNLPTGAMWWVVTVGASAGGSLSISFDPGAPALGDTIEQVLRWRAIPASRTVSDGVTSNGSPVVSSVAALFTSADVGATITGSNIPFGSTIVAVSTLRSVTDGGTTSTSTSVTSSTANFSSLDVGVSIAGVGIPVGTKIASITNATTAVMSQAATATNSGVTLGIGAARSVTDGVLNGTTTITSSTAAFSPSDVGVPITGTGIPSGTKISGYTSSTTVTISRSATTSATGVVLGIGVNAIVSANCTATGSAITFAIGPSCGDTTISGYYNDGSGYLTYSAAQVTNMSKQTDAVSCVAYPAAGTGTHVFQLGVAIGTSPVVGSKFKFALPAVRNLTTIGVAP